MQLEKATPFNNVLRAQLKFYLYKSKRAPFTERLISIGHYNEFEWQ